MLSKLKSPDSGIQDDARRVLECVFEEQDDVAPLKELLANKLAKRHAIQILATKRPGAISMDELLPWLNDPDLPVRMAALEAVRQLGPKAKTALPRLVQLSRETDPLPRVCTIAALGSMGAPSADTLCSMFSMGSNPGWDSVEILLELLKPDGDPARALVLIEQYDRQDSNAVPALLAVLVDLGDEKVIQSRPLLQALNAISKTTTPTLLKLTKHPNPDMRSKTCLALGLLKGDPGPIVPALVEGLGDPKCAVRCSAAGALGSYGSSAGSASIKLQAMRRATNAFERACVQQALQKIGSN
jgi:HEAT repeat protein